MQLLIPPILVLSDSHASLDQKITPLLEKERPKTLVHLGDINEWKGMPHLPSFEALINALNQNPDLNFVHVSGGYDENRQFDKYMQKRENAYSGEKYEEGDFFLKHNIEDIDLRDFSGKIVLHGHTHVQALRLYECYEIISKHFHSNRNTNLGPGVWYINPGVSKGDEYCIIEKQEGIYSVRFHRNPKRLGI